MNAKRLEISRLSHRFAFGPRPGEFAAALSAGVSATRQKVLTVPAVDAGAALVANPLITDLGSRPPAFRTYWQHCLTEARGHTVRI